MKKETLLNGLAFLLVGLVGAGPMIQKAYRERFPSDFNIGVAVTDYRAYVTFSDTSNWTREQFEKHPLIQKVNYEVSVNIDKTNHIEVFKGPLRGKYDSKLSLPSVTESLMRSKIIDSYSRRVVPEYTNSTFQLVYSLDPENKLKETHRVDNRVAVNLTKEGIEKLCFEEELAWASKEAIESMRRMNSD